MSQSAKPLNPEKNRDENVDKNHVNHDIERTNDKDPKEYSEKVSEGYKNEKTHNILNPSKLDKEIEKQGDQASSEGKVPLSEMAN